MHGDAGTLKILVVANETVEGDVLHDTLVRIAQHAESVEAVVVAPALNSRLKTWVSDEDGARRDAELRLASAVARLREEGFETTGHIGDCNPLQAIDDALRAFDAVEIVIATHPEGRSHWLERNLIRDARRRYDQPIRHVVVENAVPAVPA
jgi:hypothetical protein